MHLQGVLTVALVALLVTALAKPMQNSWNHLNFYDSHEDRSMEDYVHGSSKRYDFPSTSSGYKLRSVEDNSKEYGRYSSSSYGNTQRQRPATHYSGSRSVEDNSMEYGRYSKYGTSHAYRPSTQYRGRSVEDNSREYGLYKNYGNPNLMLQQRQSRPSSRYNGIYEDKNLDYQHLYKVYNRGNRGGYPSPHLHDTKYITMY